MTDDKLMKDDFECEVDFSIENCEYMDCFGSCPRNPNVKKDVRTGSCPSGLSGRYLERSEMATMIVDLQGKVKTLEKSALLCNEYREMIVEFIKFCYDRLGDCPIPTNKDLFIPLHVEHYRREKENASIPPVSIQMDGTSNVSGWEQQTAGDGKAKQSPLELDEAFSGLLRTKNSLVGSTGDDLIMFALLDFQIGILELQKGEVWKSALNAQSVFNCLNKWKKENNGKKTGENRDG